MRERLHRAIAHTLLRELLYFWRERLEVHGAEQDLPKQFPVITTTRDKERTQSFSDGEIHVQHVLVGSLTFLRDIKHVEDLVDRIRA